MNIRAFRRAGHWPTLLSAFLYFDISFMVWVLLGALANSIVGDYQLSESQKGLMVAVPLLGGALLRLVSGLMTDRIGAKITGMIGMALTTVPLLLGWLWADSYEQLLCVGLLMGVAGASFAVALPLASRWYPPQYQGLVMGIAGAGNSGTALATFFGPYLAEHIGWRGVFGLALIPIAAVFIIFTLFARESPSRPQPQRLTDYAAVLRQRDTWWFCLFYSVTFGGFVGLASFLNLFFVGQYGVSRTHAGAFATLCVIMGSCLRPLGGYLSDRLGGIRLLIAFFGGVGLLTMDLATCPPMVWGIVLLVTIMGLLGMANGAVFQLVPQRFRREIGVVTGLVGAAGGVGGFFLPTLLGTVRQWTGSFGGGFFLVGLTAFGCAVSLYQVSLRWESEFLGQGGRAAGVPVSGPPAPAFSPELMAQKS